MMRKHSFSLTPSSQDGGESDYDTAKSYIDSGNYPYAHHYLTKAALQGHLIAHYELGNMYLFGINAAPNYVRAKFFFEKATEKNHKGAWNHLGMIYAYGLGTAVDRERATQCFANAEQPYPTETRQEIIDSLFRYSEWLKISACCHPTSHSLTSATETEPEQRAHTTPLPHQR